MYLWSLIAVILIGLIKLTTKKAIVPERYKRRDNLAVWEARLKRMGLTMDAGRSDCITYEHIFGSMTDFESRDAYVPKTGDEDSLEWPISL